MTPVRARRAVTAFLVVVLSVAYLTARAEGLRPGHVCPMVASHETAGGHDVDDAHGGHHDSPAPESDGHECRCEGAGCCPPTVAGLPSMAVRNTGIVSARTTPFARTRATFAHDLLLRGAAAARAPPIQL